MAVVAAMLATPPSSAAGTLTEVPAAGPVLAGETVLWATQRDDGGFDLRTATGSGARVARGFSPEIAGFGRLRPQLVASQDNLGVVVGHRSGEPGPTQEQRDVYFGPVDGTLARLGGRCSLTGPDLPRPLDVDGPRVIFDPCDGSPGVEVRGDPLPQLIPEGRARGVRLAGRWAAWLEGGGSWESAWFRGDVVVYDRSTVRVAYRIPKEMLGRGVETLDLQDDGKVAFSYHLTPPPGGRAVAWASPQDPSVHRLPLPQERSYEVRIARDRIAFLAGNPVEFDVPLAEVGVSDLTGGVRVIARGAQDRVGPESFDFDGERVAWYTLTCREAEIHTRRVEDPPLSHRSRSGCPLVARATRVSRSGAFRLRLDCFGFANEQCAADDVRATRRGAVLARGGDEKLIRLTRAGRRVLPPGGRRTVRLSATIHDPAGRRERRTAVTTLKRSR